MKATEENWTTVGAKFTASAEDRARIQRAIDGLSWTTKARQAMMPAMAINATIEQLRLPKVTQFAISDADLRYRDGDEGWAYYQLLGIEANYSNGRVRVYVLDTGGSIVPVRSDLFAAATAA